MQLKLMGYQKEAIRRFESNNNRLLIALPTGAGKTIVAVYAINSILKNQRDRVLVITPANLKNNTYSTLQKFYPDIKACMPTKDSLFQDYKENQVLIISYNFMRMYLTEIEKLEWKMLVIDELHYAKNMTSSTFKSLAILGIRTPYLLGLTASPYSNNPQEFFTLLYIVSRDRNVLKIYRKFLKWKTVHVKSPTGRTQTKTYPVEVLYQQYFRKYFGRWIYWPTEEMIQSLSTLPKPILHVVKVPITKAEYVNYLYALKKIPPELLQKFKEGTLNNRELIKIRSWLMKAEQVLLTPDAITDGPYVDVGSKIKTVGKMIKDRKNQSIVFTQFVETGVDIANTYFNQIGLKSVVYSGKVKGDERRKIEDEYNAGNIDVICLNTAGMEGINLPTCKDVYFLSLHFNPEVIKQVQGRALRVTSKNETVDVFWMLAYYRIMGIIPKSTIDTWMANIILNKKSFRDTLQYVLVKDYTK